MQRESAKHTTIALSLEPNDLANCNLSGKTHKNEIQISFEKMLLLIYTIDLWLRQPFIYIYIYFYTSTFVAIDIGSVLILLRTRCNGISYFCVSTVNTNISCESWKGKTSKQDIQQPVVVEMFLLFTCNTKANGWAYLQNVATKLTHY